MNLCSELQIVDFAPIYWLVDAHALFHLATVPIPFWLTQFVYLETAHELRETPAYLEKTHYQYKLL